MLVFVCFFRKRAPYIAYLTRCRQGLQTSQAHLERLLQRVLRDKEVANRYFTTVCVRLLLEHMETKMLEFIKGISTIFILLFTYQPSDERFSQPHQVLHISDTLYMISTLFLPDSTLKLVLQIK